MLVGLPRLIARLPAHHPHHKKLEDELYREVAGYAGEKKVDRLIESVGIPNTATVFTNLNLSFNWGHSFQIDTLILSQQYILLLEIKNIRGHLYFESNPHQLRRMLDSEETIMECPITQLQAAMESLERGLAKRGMPVEINGQIILANRNAAVKLAPPNAPILFSRRLAIYLRELEKGPIIYSPQQLRKMIQIINQHRDTYHAFPLCEYFEINPRLLKKGQLCSDCDEIMIYDTRRQRYCIGCKKMESYNPAGALQDWFMLINPFISNRQCRYFLDLKNKDDAYYALRSVGLHKQGKSTATRYYWPKNKPFIL